MLLFHSSLSTLDRALRSASVKKAYLMSRLWVTYLFVVMSLCPQLDTKAPIFASYRVTFKSLYCSFKANTNFSVIIQDKKSCSNFK